MFERFLFFWIMVVVLITEYMLIKALVMLHN